MSNFFSSQDEMKTQDTNQFDLQDTFEHALFSPLHGSNLGHTSKIDSAPNLECEPILLSIGPESFIPSNSCNESSDEWPFMPEQWIPEQDNDIVVHPDCHEFTECLNDISQTQHHELDISLADEYLTTNSSLQVDTSSCEIIPNEYSWDDTGNAHRLKDKFGDKIRYSHAEKIWRVFDGARWIEDNSGELKRMADEVLLEIENQALPPNSAPMELMAWARHLKRSRSSNSKEAMIKEARHLEGIPISPNELDKDPLLINLNNGTFNLLTGILRPHCPDDMLTKLAGVSYDHDASCPMWEDFLKTIFDGDEELIFFVQAVIGLCLTGITKEQCMFIFFGNGQNGKSTFIETILTLLGDYAITANPETFISRDRSGATPEIVRLKGARFVSTVEPQDGVAFNEGLIKQITGNDTITARPLYAKEIQFKPEFKLIMATNHKPTIKGTDDGIWRRIRLIPFTVRIPDDQKDPDLVEKLKKELPGILNWAIHGYYDYVRFGLPIPRAVEDATKEYRTEMDLFSYFITDCIQDNVEGTTASSDLYACYKSWCNKNGHRYPMNQIKFGREMSKRFKSEHGMLGSRYPRIGFTEYGQSLLSVSFL
jgi:putative DNA primase/helicase